MVSVKNKGSGYDSKERLDVDAWLASVAEGRPAAEAEVMARACALAQRAHAGQMRASGEPYIQHSLAVANTLAELRLDYETIAAAILHDVAEDTTVSRDEIKEAFGAKIAALVDGVTKMKTIQVFTRGAEHDRQELAQTESLRKMLLAMAEDIRVVLIKLADRIHNMRTLGALPPDRQRRIAQETLDIYAPLANRLGMWQIKWELEDLALRYLEPRLYKDIARLLVERRVDREIYIKRFIEQLQAALEQGGVRDAVVSGRPKHIYSIWKKMERKQIDYHQIYDMRGVRVLVNDIRDCYTVLGIVHSRWPYISGEFDDYIATPKENNYRSIHTAVIGPEGKTVEVQIRTHEMHAHNELGVAAHWRYKEDAGRDEVFERKIAWLRQLLEWKNEIADAGEFVEQFRSEIFADRIYVFTPKGNVVDLSNGATPLDFAYHIHTDVGHRCRGARINGKMVPLTYRLQTGEQVEVLTVKQPQPSRDWLNPHLGYLHTSRARAKVQHWFRQQDRSKNLVEGRATLERELRRVGVTGVSYERLAELLGYRDVDDLFVAIAHNDVKASRYLGAAQTLLAPAARGELAPAELQRPAPAKRDRGGIRIQGVGNLLTHLAHCCDPVPGDEIRGYITIGRGVSIHRGDCPNMLRYSTRRSERVIDVAWGAAPGDTYPVEVEVTAFDRPGLLRDITAVLANERINLTATSTVSDGGRHEARMSFTLEIGNIETLSRVLAKLAQLPNVLEVRRVAH